MYSEARVQIDVDNDMNDDLLEEKVKDECNDQKVRSVCDVKIYCGENVNDDNRERELEKVIQINQCLTDTVDYDKLRIRNVVLNILNVPRKITLVMKNQYIIPVMILMITMPLIKIMVTKTTMLIKVMLRGL